MENPVFDITQPINTKVIRPEGDVVITIRFPTDEEWIDRSRRRKTRSRNLGNGKTQSIQNLPDPKDAELVNSLRVGECPEVDLHEAKRILDRISTAAINGDVVREGANLQIPLKILGVSTVHIIRIPTERERGEFLQMSGVPTVSQGNIETHGFNLGGAADLYPKLHKNAIGYVGNVSVVHALAILNAAFEFIDREIEGEDPNP